jgi:hypothetical protein
VGAVKKPWFLIALLLWCSGVHADQQEDEPTSFSQEFVESIDLGILFYLSYEYGELAGEPVSEFFVKRAYFTADADILPILSARITFDASQDLEGDGRGDMEVRLKYAFGKFHFGDWGPLTRVNLEAGIVHMVWLDFEEHVDLYRMLTPMFMERSGIFNSADFGVTLTAGIGPDLSDDFKTRINKDYPARHGSVAFGIYNGGGYHGVETNSNKAVESRLTWRPLPDRLPGLQVAGLLINGDGNQDDDDLPPPPWETYNIFTSYEFARGAVIGQYVWGEGNQRGSWVQPDDPTQSQPFWGYSFFGEYRFGSDLRWRVVGNYDHFDRRSTTTDSTFDYVSLAAGYDFGKANILMLDYSIRDYVDPTRPDDDRIQVVQQIKF